VSLTTAEYVSDSVEQTHAVGVVLGQHLQPGDIICLSGDLGAGKTVLTKGIGAGWGALEAVTSPTFTLIHEHRRAADRIVLHHVDCYRLGGAADAWGIGLEDMLHDESVLVLEWPENVADILPADRLWIALDDTGDTQRHMTLTAAGPRADALLAALLAALRGAVLRR
jgi:tRNA threonylcarbamoyladenosine biosynthesis protein TsaE